MNIVINAVFMHEKPRGVGRVCNNLLKKIAEKDKKNKYYIYYGKWQKYDFLNIKQENFKFIKLNISSNAIIRNLYLAFVLPFKIKKHDPDVYHIMDTSPLYIKTCKTISTIHDLAEFTVPEKYNKFKCVLRKKYVKKQAINSDLIVTVSEYTKKDIINRFKVDENKIKVIYNYFECTKLYDSKREYKKYFLVVGEIERTKNIGMIIESFSKINKNVRNGFKLVIVGKNGNDYRNVIEKIEQCNIKKDVELLSYVSDEKLFELYSNAFALVFASLFEGFGLPILEAMSFGIPVISSNVTSMPEVIGDAGMLFDPTKSKKLTKCMNDMIMKPDMRISMIEKGYKQIKKFNPDKIVDELLDTYREIRV